MVVGDTVVLPHYEALTTALVDTTTHEMTKSEEDKNEAEVEVEDLMATAHLDHSTARIIDNDDDITTLNCREQPLPHPYHPHHHHPPPAQPPPTPH